MAIVGRKRELCTVEEEKFYRGETSMIEKCNLGCAVTNIEKQIVLYVSVCPTIVNYMYITFIYNSSRVTSVAAERMVK